MKPYLSLWSNGYYNDFDEQKKQFLLNCYKMSAFLLLKHYKEAHLITDFQGAEFLNKIPFTSVDTCLEDLPEHCSILWSLGKLYAYKNISKKGDPFFHIDHDVFLVNKLSEAFIKEDLFVQHEEFYAFYEYDIQGFFNCIPNKYILGKFLPTKAYNMGIFGGQDVEFINKFASEGLKVCLDKQNLEAIKNNNFKYHYTPCLATEQYIFSVMCHLNNKNPKPLIELSDRKNNGNSDNIEIIEKRGEHIKYFHFWTEKYSDKRIHLINKINNFGATIFN
jgi:hypothetical protein